MQVTLPIDQVRIKMCTEDALDLVQSIGALETFVSSKLVADYETGSPEAALADALVWLTRLSDETRKAIAPLRLNVRNPYADAKRAQVPVQQVAA